MKLIEFLKQQILEMNGFECPQCLHKGSSDPFPPLPKTKKNNLTNEEYKQVRKSEICCYYRNKNQKTIIRKNQT